MTFRRFRTPRVIHALLAGALCVAAPVAAQYQPDPAAALSDYLKRLASNPRDSGALIGAGDAALAMGDPEGAVGFFGRAEEILPRDGRVKAGLGSALLQLGDPEAALRFFDEAQTLGLPGADMAKDRGLAYDLTGDPRRAQREYRLGLQQGPDDETSRNLALSLAISGDRLGALQAIDDQVRRQDRAAWRTRAFVLALTGDSGAATQAAAGVMRSEQAEAMRPFFARLPQLTLEQRARAVHLGEMPPEGMQVASRAGSLPADQSGVLSPSNSNTRARDNDGPTSPLLRRRPVPSGTEPSRRSSRSQRNAPPAPQPDRTVAAITQPTPAPAPTPAPSPPPPPAPAITTTSLPPSAPAGSDFSGVAKLVVALPEDETVSGPPASAPAPPPSRSGPPRPVAGPYAPMPDDISKVPRIVRAPGKDPVIVLPPSEVKEPVIETAEAKVPEKKPAPKKAAPAKPAEPSRHWVQIAGGANKAALPGEFKRLQGKAPKLLNGRTAWTTPLRATNRLLVGPFKSEAEAQGFVNDLADFELTAFSWTSPDGQKIEKLAAK